MKKKAPSKNPFARAASVAANSKPAKKVKGKAGKKMDVYKG